MKRLAHAVHAIATSQTGDSPAESWREQLSKLSLTPGERQTLLAVMGQSSVQQWTDVPALEAKVQSDEVPLLWPWPRWA